MFSSRKEKADKAADKGRSTEPSPRGSEKSPRSNTMASKLVAALPFGNMSDAIERGRVETEAQSARAEINNKRDAADSSIPFAALDSANAWSDRKSQAEDHEKAISARRMNVRRDPTEKRLEKYMEGMADRMPGGKETAEKMKPVTPILAILIKGLFYFARYSSMAFDALWKVWMMLPKTLAMVVYGVGLCFFGGTFVVAIAGMEAFYAAGWRRAYYSALYVYDESRQVGYALELDDYEDADKDGIADVDQITSDMLVQRKTLLAFTTVKKPDELQTAFANVWAAYLAVLATLKFQFARTTAFAIAMAQSLQFLFLKIFGPPLSYLLPEKMHHWVPVIIDTVVNVIALFVAWFIQQVISAVVSGLRGGMLASRATLSFTNDRGWSNIDETTSLIDETAGLLLAAAGIYFQLANGFVIPFPFILIIWPVVVVEWYLRWQVTFA
ncbi:hypothetical protein T492DRAFT_965793 [Pavlovales sp. CCMP2436]|nr:hypothetical protein T492DRAFT_965793 [Pavlovales sp. CCMP2436]|mmetsp:Transcript_12225/g.30783  ORF Transcript_12225/g.30783 Transcript_12225/m.30783 type:complete len:442 (+) Transcript_12225:135-1460(+)|eukprot:CAMPEP_0179893954 /NCGR_PEP_ID=MMETSP0982-20121206/35037_1 /TAXON_ID=483367 /ORGANISM="non described non described, Strain CCMP 2436" /LENGTH=441 /DNA_ID=CAMNT_0021790531 /DNA_START=135 /DNA_END=1460 /DNA_ORIENTATION=+